MRKTSRIVLTLVALTLLDSCSRNKPAASGTGPTKVKVAWIGLTCEAPIFSAYENGFFKDEGLDVELVKTDWNAMKDGLGLDRFDATHTLVPYLLKPIEQGLDVKFTAGIHKGCLRVQAGAKSGITKIEDLKGKRIAVANMGSPPFIFTNRVLAAHGLDPSKDVTFVMFPSDTMELALDKGQVDAVANSEPIGSMLLATGKVRTIADQALDAPYKDEYCCAVAVSGAFARRDPSAAAKVTRAMLKGAKWVSVNPAAAAKLSIEKGYLAANVDLNASALSKLTYLPAVADCRTGIAQQSLEMKKAGMLNAGTDPAELGRRAWIDLPDVSDQWIGGLAVEQVPGGGPVFMSDAALAALLRSGKIGGGSCCVKK